MFEEKLREDAIRDEGWGVVRWTWRDLRARTAGRAGYRRAPRTAARRLHRDSLRVLYPLRALLQNSG